MSKRQLTNPLDAVTGRAQIDRYNLSFTASSLRPELARIVAEAYLDCRDWDLAKQRVLLENALQSRTASSRIRMEREIRQRIQTLTPPQTQILATAPSDSRTAIAWLSMLKISSFVFDFAAETLRSKLETSDTVLRPSDYETFCSAKSVSHPELAAITPSTQAKIRQVLLTMLREAGILSESDNAIRRPVLPHDVQQAITTDDHRWLAGFLVPDSEIRFLRGARHGL